MGATCHYGSHDRVEELGMGGSRPPHGGLCEEDQNCQTFAKKIKTAELVTPAKNVISTPIESIFASASIPVKSVCDGFPVESFEFVGSVKNSFPFNMISDSAYLLALDVFISKIGKKTLNNKELKQGYLGPIKEET